MKKYLVALSLSLLLSACGSSPGAELEKFHEAAAAGHSAEAMEFIDPSLRQTFGPKLVTGMSALTKKVQQQGGVKSQRVINEAIDGDYAKVKMETVFGNGQKSTSEEKMRKVDGKWYVTF